MLTLNLLPSAKKHRLYLEKLERLCLSYAFLISMALGLFVLLLGGGLIYMHIESEKIRDDIKREELTATAQETRGLEENLETSSKTLSLANQIIENNPPLIPILEKLIEILPREIILSTFSLRRDTKKIVLNGFAPTRENLLEFENALKQTPLFTKINFPLSNLTTKENIDFTLDFEYLDD